MATLFSGDVTAKGVPGTLMTEKKENGKISISASFTVGEKQEGHDKDGRKVSVAGQKLTWYSTLTEKTRARSVESLILCGLSEAAAERVIAKAEEGVFGKIADKFGFGTREVSLNCAIDTYNGKSNTKVNWINAPGGRRSKAADAPVLDLGDDVAAEPGNGTASGGPDKDDPFAS